ncbi:hypothetical protein BS78_05G110600 [Paspalum vaginatum]|nr:hypothetical protein BS78_05G110600 [Paspalum vaginatum]
MTSPVVGSISEVLRISVLSNYSSGRRCSGPAAADLLALHCVARWQSMGVHRRRCVLVESPSVGSCNNSKRWRHFCGGEVDLAWLQQPSSSVSSGGGDGVHRGSWVLRVVIT